MGAYRWPTPRSLQAAGRMALGQSVALRRPPAVALGDDGAPRHTLASGALQAHGRPEALVDHPAERTPLSMAPRDGLHAAHGAVLAA